MVLRPPVPQFLTRRPREQRAHVGGRGPDPECPVHHRGGPTAALHGQAWGSHDPTWCEEVGPGDMTPGGPGLPLWGDPSRSPRGVSGADLFGVIERGVPTLREDTGQAGGPSLECTNIVHRASSVC